MKRDSGLKLYEYGKTYKLGSAFITLKRKEVNLMINIILLMLIKSTNELFIKELMVNFYEVKVRGVISGYVISLYINLYKILHPP